MKLLLFSILAGVHSWRWVKAWAVRQREGYRAVIAASSVWVSWFESVDLDTPVAVELDEPGPACPNCGGPTVWRIRVAAACRVSVCQPCGDHWLARLCHCAYDETTPGQRTRGAGHPVARTCAGCGYTRV